MTYEEFCNERGLIIKAATPTNRDDWDIGTANHFNVTIGDGAHTLLYTKYSMGSGHATAWAKKAPSAILGRAITEGACVDAFANAVRKKPELIPVADVIMSLAMDAACGDQRFEDFCDDLGYDPDSLKAKGIWEACNSTRHDLIAAFGKRGTEILLECEEE